MTVNFSASKLSYVIVNNGGTDLNLEKGETWKFIVNVDDAFDAYNQMSKCKQAATRFNHDIMNVYLDGKRFNPRGWYTDGVNEDKIIYNDKIKIDNLSDQSKRKASSSGLSSESQKKFYTKKNNIHSGQETHKNGNSKPQRQDITVTLSEHARLDCMTLRFGILLPNEIFKFSGHYDSEGTSNQKPREISNGNEHFIGSLFVNASTTYKNMRVVLSKAGLSEIRNVISILPPRKNLSTRAVSDLIRDLREKKKITPEQIVGVLHPLYKSGKISNEADFFEELIKIGISQKDQSLVSTSKRTIAPTNKKKSNNHLLLMSIFVVAIIYYWLIPELTTTHSKDEPIGVDDPTGIWKTSGCSANLITKNKHIHKMILKREGSKTYLELMANMNFPKGDGKIFIKANIGETITERYKTLVDQRSIRVDFSLYSSYLNKADHLSFVIGEVDFGKVMLPSDTKIELNKIEKC